MHFNNMAFCDILGSHRSDYGNYHLPESEIICMKTQSLEKCLIFYQATLAFHLWGKRFTLRSDKQQILKLLRQVSVFSHHLQGAYKQY